MASHIHHIQVADLGRTAYADCLRLQRQIFRLRSERSLPDVLLLTEHDHVYTCGTSTDEDHLLAGETELTALGAQVVRTDRGGDITYHGPGQIVAYPILDLHDYYLDLHRYLRDLEEAVIRMLAMYHVRGTRINGYSGVWVKGEKICAIGIRTGRWVTMHGFALNISTDLSYFSRIIPCGIFERGVTSLAEVLGTAVDLSEARARLAEAFGAVFGAAMVRATLEELLQSGRAPQGQNLFAGVRDRLESCAAMADRPER